MDPATEKGYDVDVDNELGLITLRRAKDRAEEPLPRALIPGTPFRTYVQRDAVLRFAQAQERYPALVEILERRPPRTTSSSKGRRAPERRRSVRGWRSNG